MPTYPHGYTFSRDVSAKEKLIANSNNVVLIGEEFFCDVCTARVVVGHFPLPLDVLLLFFSV